MFSAEYLSNRRHTRSTRLPLLLLEQGMEILAFCAGWLLPVSHIYILLAAERALITVISLKQHLPK